MKCIITFYEHAQRTIAESPAEKRVTWAYIKTTLASTLQKVVDTKFMDPKTDAIEVKDNYDLIVREIEEAFQTIAE